MTVKDLKDLTEDIRKGLSLEYLSADDDVTIEALANKVGVSRNVMRRFVIENYKILNKHLYKMYLYLKSEGYFKYEKDSKDS